MPALHRARQLQANSTFDRATILDSAAADDPEVVLVATAQRVIAVCWIMLTS